jgi:hypothetical protein
MPAGLWPDVPHLFGSNVGGAAACGLTARPCCRISRKRPDTVGELKSAEIYVFHVPSLKAKKLGNLAQEKVLLEL